MLKDQLISLNTELILNLGADHMINISNDILNDTIETQFI